MTTREHRADIKRIGVALQAEADSRDWCDDYDTFVEALNARLTVPLITRPVTSSYRLWEPRMAEDVWSKGWINQWYNHIWPLAAGYMAHGKKTNLTQREAQRLENRFQGRLNAGRPPLVTNEQADQGREWLANYWKRHDLPDLDYRAITHFAFRGVKAGEPNNYGNVQTAPIYRAFWADGSNLTYSVNAWQDRNDDLSFTYRPAPKGATVS